MNTNAKESARWEEMDSEGTSAYAQGDYARAEEVLLAAVKEAESFEGNDLRLCQSLDNLAKVKEAQEGYEEAAALYERSLDIKEGAVGSGHPEHLKAISQLSQFYLNLGELRRAEQLAELVWCMASFGPAATPEAISKAYESSLQLQNTILALKESALGANHEGVAFTVHNIASLNFTREDYAAAELFGLRYLKIMEDLYGPEDRMLGSALEHLTKIYQAQGNAAESEAYQKRFEKTMGVLKPADEQEQRDDSKAVEPGISKIQSTRAGASQEPAAVPLTAFEQTKQRWLRSFKFISICTLAALREQSNNQSPGSKQQNDLIARTERVVPDYLTLTAEEEKEEQTMQSLIQIAAAFNAGQPPSQMPPGARPAYMEGAIMITNLQAWSGSGKLWKVKRALIDGADVNAPDENGITALHYAVRRGEETVVRLLLQAGANVVAKAPSGETPVAIAMAKQDDRLMQLMLSHLLKYSS